MPGFSEKPSPSSDQPEANSERESEAPDTYVGRMVTDYYQKHSGEIETMKRFKERFPDKFRQLNKLVASNLSSQELKQGIQEFNENPNLPKKGAYDTFHLPEDATEVGGSLTVKFFENGRVRISLPHGRTTNPDKKESGEKSVLDTESGLTFQQLIRKHDLTDGAEAAFEKTKKFSESSNEEGTILHGKLDGDVTRGESIEFRNKKGKTSTVRSIEERNNMVFIQTDTSEYVVGQIATTDEKSSAETELPADHLIEKYGLKSGQKVAFKKEEIFDESPIDVGTVKDGTLKNDIESGESIQFADKDAVISNVDKMYENNGELHIVTQTSRYKLVYSDKVGRLE